MCLAGLSGPRGARKAGVLEGAGALSRGGPVALPPSLARGLASGSFLMILA